MTYEDIEDLKRFNLVNEINDLRNNARDMKNTGIQVREG